MELQDWRQLVADWWRTFEGEATSQKLHRLLPIMEALRPGWEQAWKDTQLAWQKAGAPGDIAQAEADCSVARAALSAIRSWCEGKAEAGAALHAGYNEFYPRSLEISGDIHQVAASGQAHCWYFCGFLATSLAVATGRDDGGDGGDFLGFVCAFADAESDSLELAELLAPAMEASEPSHD